MVPFAGLLAALDQIPDPRRLQGQRYRLAFLLLFSVLAVLAGVTSYRRIRLFIGVHRERLNATFGARFRRAPAVNTLRALLHALDPAMLPATMGVTVDGVEVIERGLDFAQGGQSVMQARLVVLDAHQQRVAGRRRGGERFFWQCRASAVSRTPRRPSRSISAWAAATSSPPAIS